MPRRLNFAPDHGVVLLAEKQLVQQSRGLAPVILQAVACRIRMQRQHLYITEAAGLQQEFQQRFRKRIPVRRIQVEILPAHQHVRWVRGFKYRHAAWPQNAVRLIQERQKRSEEHTSELQSPMY